MSIVWLIAFAGFLALEGATVSLTSIWFAGGSLAALAVQAAGGDLQVQLGAFAAVSFILLLMVRPFAANYVRTRKKTSDMHRFVGRQVVVKERIDNAAGTGSAVLGGETWLARSKEEEPLEPGQRAVVVEVRGAKLILTPAGGAESGPDRGTASEEEAG